MSHVANRKPHVSMHHLGDQLAYDTDYGRVSRTSRSHRMIRNLDGFSGSQLMALRDICDDKARQYYNERAGRPKRRQSSSPSIRHLELAYESTTSLLQCAVGFQLLGVCKLQLLLWHLVPAASLPGIRRTRGYP